MKYYITIDKEFESEKEAKDFIKDNLAKVDTYITSTKPKTTYINWYTGKGYDTSIKIKGE